MVIGLLNSKSQRWVLPQRTSFRVCTLSLRAFLCLTLASWFGLYKRLLWCTSQILSLTSQQHARQDAKVSFWPQVAAEMDCIIWLATGTLLRTIVKARVEWLTLIVVLPDAVTHKFSRFHSCKGTTLIRRPSAFKTSANVSTSRRGWMWKCCSIVLMRFLMQIGHDTWLWPLDGFQCIISLIHCSKHRIYINLGTQGVIQADQKSCSR